MKKIKRELLINDTVNLFNKSKFAFGIIERIDGVECKVRVFPSKYKPQGDYETFRLSELVYNDNVKPSDVIWLKRLSNTII